MGSFKQHVTCSTVTGIIIGGAAYNLGFSLPTSLLSAGLCSIAGMLPDIDSDTSRSYQECIYLAAGLCAVLLVHRLLNFDLSQDVIILAGAGMFLIVRFVVGEFIKKMTCHRGMFHSVPAAILAGQIVYFLSAGTTVERIFKAASLTAGYMSHLILDEIYSIDSTGRTLRLKKSFGTALKLIDTKRLPITAMVYAVIVTLAVTAVKSPDFIEGLEESHRLLAAEEETTPSAADRSTSTAYQSSESNSERRKTRRQAIRKEIAEFLASHISKPGMPASIGNPGAPAPLANTASTGFYSSAPEAEMVRGTASPYQLTALRDSDGIRIPTENDGTFSQPNMSAPLRESSISIPGDSPIDLPLPTYSTTSTPAYSSPDSLPPYMPPQPVPQTEQPYGSPSIPPSTFGISRGGGGERFNLLPREPARISLP